MQTLTDELSRSRTCYKHLAGELGVSITRQLLRHGCIENAAVRQKHCFAITAAGHKWCQQHGIDRYLSAAADGLPKGAGRDLTLSCLDHSHCVPHLAGRLGRAVLAWMLAQDYCRTAPGRRVPVTAQGAVFLRNALAMDWPYSRG